MFKVFSGIALAVGAGAFYYWWNHERDNVDGTLQDARDDIRDTARDLSHDATRS